MYFMFVITFLEILDVELFQEIRNFCVFSNG